MRRAIIVGCFLVLICMLGTLTAGMLGYGWYTLQQQASVIHTPTVAATAPARPTAAPTQGAATQTPTSAPSPTTVPPSTITATSVTGSAAFDTLSAIEETRIPIRDLYELGIRFGKIAPDTPRVVRESAPAREIGDTEQFSVSDVSSGEYFTVTAVLSYATTHAYWWIEEGFDVSDEALRESTELFESRTYPTNRDFFGSEWTPGIDGEEQVHIFLGNVPGVGGYFSSADEFPRAVNQFSNEKEMFYINLANARPGDPWFDGILAHEFQHMIHWNQDRNEEIWINEGLSELAVRLNDLGEDRSIQAFLEDPDLQLTHWFEQISPHYGASFLFMEYLLDRLGDETMRKIVAHPANGEAGIDAVVAEQGLTFEQLFADWVVANYVDDPEGGRYAHPAHQLEQPAIASLHDSFPVLSREAAVHQFGADYIKFEDNGRAGTLTIEFAGEETISVVPATAHSGEFVVWSNSGDDSDSTLTRAFDLTELDSATLTYWAWYDIETDYDYAYVTVSTDGGETWQPLEAEDTTTTNPHGNSFGPAYTGKSGVADDDSDAESKWVELEADLTPFVGQDVLVRFEYITDDALHGNGFLLDDVRVPELDYSEDFEAGLGEWNAAGWVRIDNVLQQEYIVQALVFTDEGFEMQTVELDAGNQGQLSVNEFGGSVDNVVLIVSSATPVTTNKATYTYSASFATD